MSAMGSWYVRSPKAGIGKTPIRPIDVRTRGKKLHRVRRVRLVEFLGGRHL